MYFASLLSARRVGVGGGGLRRGRVRAGGGWHGSGVGWGLKFETEVDTVHTLRHCMAQSCLAATKQPSMALFESLFTFGNQYMVSAMKMALGGAFARYVFSRAVQRAVQSRAV